MYLYTCENCGIEFKRSHKKNKRTFCSHPCYSDWLKKGNGNSAKTRFKKGHEGYFKGKKLSREHREKISKNHSVLSNPIGESAQNWKGGRIKRLGYISVYRPDHPNCNKQGYVKEHRLVMEGIIGRYLKTEEVVHHIDRNKENNSPDNLILFKNDSEHHKHHWKIKRYGNKKES